MILGPFYKAVVIGDNKPRSTIVTNVRLAIEQHVLDANAGKKLS